MQYIAINKNVKISPRKVRIVSDSIKKLSLEEALVYLDFIQKRAAFSLKKTLKSAVSNATNNFKAKRENLVIKEILVNDGFMYKRYHYAARGRVRPYKKRTTHIRVVLEDKVLEKVPQEVKGKEPKKIENMEAKTKVEKKKSSAKIAEAKKGGKK